MFKRKEPEFKVGKSSHRNWYQDRYQSVQVQRNLILVIAFSALMAALASGISMSALAPLKSVQPFLITVDEETGSTRVIDAKKDPEISADKAIAEYFVIRYIMARESYNSVYHNTNWSIVSNMTDSRIMGAYQKQYGNDPESLLFRYGASMTRKIDIVSSALLDDKQVNRAQVIIKSTIDSPGLLTPEINYYRILLDYEYVTQQVSKERMYINPLGFQVNAYVISEENQR